MKTNQIGLTSIALTTLCLCGATTPATAAIGVDTTLATINQSSTSFSLTPADSLQSFASSNMTINLNQGSGLLSNSAAMATFNKVAQYYSSLFSDPVTLNINVNMAALGSGILGSTSTTLYTGNYDLIRNAMVSDQVAYGISGDITNFLPTANQFSAYTPSGFSLGNLMLTSANAKALGFAVNPVSDASITFSSAFNFDYNSSDGISAGSFDFEGIVMHEFGHALGFISAVDEVDYMLTNNLSGTINPTTLDLFRLTPGDGQTDFTLSPRILVTGNFSGFGEQVSYFGVGEEYAMSTGDDNGDGRQASHWKDNLGIGILDPTFAPGETGYFTAADLRSFDVIGWDTAAVPVPAAAWLFGSGLLGLIGIARQKTA